MRNLIFPMYAYQYGVIDWDLKKNKIIEQIDENLFVRNPSFFSDRQNSKKYLPHFLEIFEDELNLFRNEIQAEITVSEVWTVLYKTGDFHPTHNHSSQGFSGILYLDYDEEEHDGTYFINSNADPITDLTNYALHPTHEGAMIIVPSRLLHFTYPNKSLKDRRVIGFDIKF